MKTDLTFDVMEKMLPAVTAIITDDDIRAAMDELRAGKKQPVDTFGAIMARLLVNREATMEIAAAIQGITTDEVAQQEFSATIKTLAKDAILENMLLFFVLWLRILRRA